LLLERFTVTPPAGAAADRVTGKARDWPRPTVAVDGSEIEPAFCTVMVAVALEMLTGDDAAAVMVAEPAATGVTLKVAVVAFALMVTEPGSETIPVGAAVRFTVIAEGAAADKVTVKVRLSGPEKVTVAGERLSDALTETVVLPAV
jgi:hypothetical protein